LPWDDGSFDVLLFGFCLYLCDPEDLFRIAAEADRVLKPTSWLLIHDFFSPAHIRRPYHHKNGVITNKMDFRKLFDWHSAYSCYYHRVSAHGAHGFTDDPQEWVATSILRKQALGKT
jgi:ubiquinone/menaquinone biosynthesis C-methylase UbiE